MINFQLKIYTPFLFVYLNNDFLNKNYLNHFRYPKPLNIFKM